MTAHVFVVDERTFPLHLRYQFAGTGAGQHSYMDFNGKADTNFHHSTENMLAGMIADVSRIRIGDKIIFYLQASAGMEGQFYGVFHANSAAFLDNENKQQFLLRALGKSLTFRALIEPDTVYPKGVTEWHALDEIRHLNAPYQMLWSLIYRKLKGNRGCTMITPYEANMLCRLIRERNEGRPLSRAKQALDFDANNREIIVSDKPASDFQYSGNRKEFSLLPRIVKKDAKGQSFEALLQAHIVQHLGRAGDSLSQILLENAELEWLGNEVSCGVGMQRIDIMLSYSESGGGMRHVMPIELKAVPASEGNIRQIQRYVDWIQQYYIPNRRSVISPVLLTKKGGVTDNLRECIHNFNRENADDICKPLRMVEFSVAGSAIDYDEIVVS